MSNPLNGNGPQAPVLLKTPLEVYSNLRQLQQSRDPLLINFPDRQQIFQSYLLDIDLESGLLAFDELVPALGDRLLKEGEPFNVESYHEGIRITWKCESQVSAEEMDGAPCYWTQIPEQITYHQRRDAYRAAIPETEPVDAELLDKAFKAPLFARLIDISATGCRLRFSGDLSNRLQPGARVENITLRIGSGQISTSAEIRHVEFAEKFGCTFAGVHFNKPSGLEQRNIDRYVYQLQREARRTQE